MARARDSLYIEVDRQGYAACQAQLQQAQEELLATEIPPGCSHRTKRRYRCYDCDRTFCKRCIKAHCGAETDTVFQKWGVAIERAEAAERDAAEQRALAERLKALVLSLRWQPYRMATGDGDQCAACKTWRWMPHARGCALVLLALAPAEAQEEGDDG